MLDVILHGDFLGRPGIGNSVFIVFSGPSVRHGKYFIGICLGTVDYRHLSVLLLCQVPLEGWSGESPHKGSNLNSNIVTVQGFRVQGSKVRVSAQSKLLIDKP